MTTTQNNPLAPEPVDRNIIRRALDQLIVAAANHWGAGSTEHNLVRDISDAIAKLPNAAPSLAMVEQGPDVDAWQPIDHPDTPHACHVMAARLDPTFGEWIYGVVLSPPTTPFTHWRLLPDPPRAALGASKSGNERQSVDDEMSANPEFYR